jgi:type 1 fimbriae regulatory protein FimE
MILVAYLHALRASEVCKLEWSAIDFTRAELHVARKKSGKAATHPLRGDELREWRKLRKESTGPFVFVSERGAPFTAESFSWVVKRTGRRAEFPFQVHAHMLRDAAGYKLAGDGHDTRSIQDYMGHQDIRHTVRYTALSPKPFRDFWRD